MSLNCLVFHARNAQIYSLNVYMYHLPAIANRTEFGQTF